MDDQQDFDCFYKSGAKTPNTFLYEKYFQVPSQTSFDSWDLQKYYVPLQLFRSLLEIILVCFPDMDLEYYKELFQTRERSYLDFRFRFSSFEAGTSRDRVLTTNVLSARLRIFV